jgi:hypothetical protein
MDNVVGTPTWSTVMATTPQEIGRITEHMDVVTSCGKLIGKVDHVYGSHIKLTKHDAADGKHHEIPTTLVHSVDSMVHLSRNAAEVEGLWTTE